MFCFSSSEPALKSFLTFASLRKYNGGKCSVFCSSIDGSSMFLAHISKLVVDD